MTFSATATLICPSSGRGHRWHEGYDPVGVDVTAFFRAWLRACPTTHYCAAAGRALPGIPLGLVGRGALFLAGTPLPSLDEQPAEDAFYNEDTLRRIDVLG